MKKLIMGFCVVLTMVVFGVALAAGDADEKTVVHLVSVDANAWDPAVVIDPGFFVYAPAYERLVRYNRPGGKTGTVTVAGNIMEKGCGQYELDLQTS